MYYFMYMCYICTKKKLKIRLIKVLLRCTLKNMNARSLPILYYIYIVYLYLFCTVIIRYENILKIEVINIFPKYHIYFQFSHIYIYIRNNIIMKIFTYHEILFYIVYVYIKLIDVIYFLITYYCSCTMHI